ncbi:MAG: DNA double-strand break repair nuclease NurA [Chloroflexi bacterium]|nr:DNA double-strand break repair nuclease NurA [Chloroflexota bacterium]
MTLHLPDVIAQIEDMAEELRRQSRESGQRLERALGTLKQADGPALAARLEDPGTKVTWLVPRLPQANQEPPSARHPAPPCPTSYTVVATDGSHIDVDRNMPASCHLINIGTVVLSYGEGTGAVLSSRPRLYTGADAVIAEPTGAGREEQVRGAVLAARRMVEEVAALAEALEAAPAAVPTVGLLDGTLILWGLEAAERDFVREALVREGIVAQLRRLEALARRRPLLAVASYISYPGATEVASALRVAVCPHEPGPDCDRHCAVSRPATPACRACAAAPQGRRECDAVGGLADRQLFETLLEPGQRSALFASRSKVVRQQYEPAGQGVCFFYLRGADEIGRVELPQWAAQDGPRLDLLHAVVLDQCRRGYGYPRALIEAHEQAVVSGADREAFWRAVEGALAERGLPRTTSGKSESKRTRWL